MENIFVLTVLVALAVVGLLGFFLAASEKELKVKRREVEELLTKLESALPGGAPIEAAVRQPDNSAELTELRSEKQELQSQVDALSGKLELSRRSIEELETSQRNAGATQAETQQLRAANEELKGEINDLRSRLHSTENGSTLSAAQHQEAAERHAQLQSEIIELKQKLQDSHTKLHEVEAYRQKAERLDAFESEQRAERQETQARIAELENELKSHQDKLREMAELRQRLAEAQAALRAESERHEQEIGRWRERIGEGEENRRRLAQLRAAYDQLLSKQASLSDRQREFQEELAAFVHLMAAPSQETYARDASSAAQASVREYAGQSANASGSSVAPAPADENVTTGSAPREPEKRRFGLFSVLILLAAVGFAGVKYLNSISDPPSVPTVNASAVTGDDRRAAVMPLPSVAPAPDTGSEQAGGETLRPETAPAKPNRETAKANPVAKPEPRLAGTYEIVRSGRVYAGPTEFSQSVGEIEPGMKVNVVSARDGWLEIHSKHGRPPGFIRKEIAARLGDRN
jgi:hypothetical protein